MMELSLSYLWLCSILFMMNTLIRPDVNTMTQTTTMTVRLNPTLSEFVAANVGSDGAYENVSEYMRDLIRRDMERKEKVAFERLKTELVHAFSAPEADYQPLSAADVIARNADLSPKGT